ncbi:MAG: SulP family inorganic anion transporter [Bacillota bacterium]
MFTHFLSTIRDYNWEYFKADLISGLSVAAIALPQNMAYALIIGISPIYGLYTSLVSMIVATVVGVSEYMVVGPTNMMALAMVSSLHHVSEANYLQVIFLLTLMVGIFQILLGVLQVGELVNYVSHSVIVGLSTGVALLIGIGQLDNLLGITIDAGINVLTNLYALVVNLDAVNYYSLGLGIISMLSIIVVNQINLKFPPYLAPIILSIPIVYLFDWQSQVEVISNFSSSLPQFSWVEFKLANISRLFSSALSLAILGFIQVISITKTLEKRAGDEAKPNQEIIGQGIINIICAHFNSFAISGSFTNSFANYETGAKTRFAQLVVAIAMILFILLFSPLTAYIPISSLAAIVIMVAYNMINPTEIVRTFRTTQYDAVILTVTLLTTILAPRLDYAIYFGVLVSIIIVLKDTSEINYSHISYEQEGREFKCQDYEEVKDDQYIVINLAGNLHFHSSQKLKEELEGSFKRNTVFVIRTRDVEGIDITSIHELDKFIERVQKNGGDVLLCGMDDETFDSLDKSGVIDKIEEQNVFRADDDIFSSTKEAIEEAENRND